MNLSDLPGFGELNLGTRFRLVSLLPLTVLAAVALAEVASGAPQRAPSWERFTHRLVDLSGAELAALGVAIVTLALLAHPLQLSLVRLLEGYALQSGLGGLLARPALAMWQRRWDQLDNQQQLAGPQPPTLAEQRRMAAAAQRLRRLPARERLLPTELGNVLRSAEDRPGMRYGFDLVVLWPALYALLPDRLVAAVDDARNQLDLACRLCAACVLAGVFSLAVLAPYGWWLAVAAGFAALALLAYRGAIRAAATYGEITNAAVDLHRFDLRTALHLPLPTSLEEERQVNAALARWLRQGIPLPLVYRHPGTGFAAEPGSAGGPQLPAARSE